MIIASMKLTNNSTIVCCIFPRTNATYKMKNAGAISLKTTQLLFK
uniref:Uncharacterized protein n=1 Tax=Rhizophora mucronata TaxID=61149 RepID=A0A2P2J1K3_RHIMU